MYQSTGDGDNWEVIPAFSDIETYVLGAGNGSIFVVTFDAGGNNQYFRSVNAGLTWEESGCNYGEITFNHSGQLFMVSAYEGKVLKSIDNGDTWFETQAGLANAPVRGLAANNNGKLAASSGFATIAYSSDQGETWVNKKNFTEQEGLSPGDIALNDAGDIFVFGWQLGPIGLFRSLDGGETWTGVNVLSNTLAPFINKDGHLFVPGYEGNVWRSEDNGDTWSPLGPGIGTYEIQTVAAGENGEIFAGCFSGIVFRTLDGGATWENLIVADTAIIALAYNGPTLVLAGTLNGGLFRSGDYGETWVQTAALSSSITDIVIKNEDDIVAATEAHGVFSSGDGGNTWFGFNTGAGESQHTGTGHRRQRRPVCRHLWQRRFPICRRHHLRQIVAKQ
ncbi:MAG: hypothetical protein IPN33_01070 [Saprospiraceae bacterium]|nr:hypothetical protein [Saprospiraceae bacterium]